MRCLLLFAAVLPLAAQCGYVFQTSSPYATILGNQYIQSYSNIPGAGYSDVITLTVTDYYRTANCNWSYTSDSPWLTLDGTAKGTVTAGSITYSIPWSATGNAGGGRLGHLNFSATGYAGSAPISQLGVPCTLAIGSTSGTYPVTGGSDSFTVQTSCGWSASSGQNWISVGANSNGNGNGTVKFTVAANTCVGSRVGSIGVSVPGSSSANFRVNQDGSQNNLTLSPTSIDLPASGGIGRFTVNTGDGCGWSAYSDSTWLTITGVGMANGTGPIGYSVPANLGAARTGDIHVGSQTFTVNQDSGIAVPTPQVTSVQNAASYIQGPVSPGEIISIFGTSLGPKTGVGLQLTPDGKSITTSLGGTQVFFDGTAAPLTYVSALQINAVVPYGVAGKTSTQLQITYQGLSSSPQSLQVQPVTPAIFTLDRNGIGSGAILNQDYSINSSGKPASVGSVVMIYCTGGGVTNPASADASITTGAPPLAAQNVTVTIGGAPAKVSYSGGAPGSVAGLVQINATVPNGIASGQVPITLQIAGSPAQNGVTLSIQ